MENWKSISEYPNYEVSNTGKVRNINSGRILKPRLAKGYERVILCDHNICKPKTVHRLVAQTFIRDTNNNLQVNHKDGNKLNNNVENLEWVTVSENLSHAYRIGLKNPPRPNPRKVKIVETNEIFNSMAECARHINGSKTHIGECLDGKRTTHMGYHFEEMKERR